MCVFDGRAGVPGRTSIRSMGTIQSQGDVPKKHISIESATAMRMPSFAPAAAWFN